MRVYSLQSAHPASGVVDAAVFSLRHRVVLPLRSGCLLKMTRLCMAARRSRRYRIFLRARGLAVLVLSIMPRICHHAKCAKIHALPTRAFTLPAPLAHSRIRLARINARNVARLSQ
jgi:hypothetical protein